MANPFIGQITLFAGNFAPRGWALCQGQLLQINQNPALFSLLGTFYGGDGRTTFGLPDLRGRVAVNQGSGPGLSIYQIGSKVGAENVTLSTAQIPAHSHGVTEQPVQVLATTQDGDQTAPGPTRRLSAAKLSTGQNMNLYSSAAPNTTLGGLQVTGAPTTQPTGGSQSHTNVQPYQTLHYIIALVGVFPSRN